jgi:uncharacterized repeat protein (TIGR03803 family)
MFELGANTMLRIDFVIGLCALAIAAPLGSACAKDSKIVVIDSFKGGKDGANPQAGLITDAAGNFYGTTSGAEDGESDHGTVFKIAPDGTETVLYRFTGGEDGGYPLAGLVADGAGNLYGTTSEGGRVGCLYGTGCGSVFKLTPNGTETVLHNFKGRKDGAYPYAGLVADAAGNLYGTTAGGGKSGSGTIFKIAPDGKETVLHRFSGADGGNPKGALFIDVAGNLYGTTDVGGTANHGTVFRLSPDGTETVLYSFKDHTGGSYPDSNLIADDAGNLYGTASYGGANQAGTVFRLAPDSTYTVLYNFTGGADGAEPDAGLIADGAGSLYGTTKYGGTMNVGTVFKLAVGGSFTVLYSFEGGKDGAWPLAGLIADGGGNLYGTAYGRGKAGMGVVFEIPAQK